MRARTRWICCGPVPMATPTVRTFLNNIAVCCAYAHVCDSRVGDTTYIYIYIYIQIQHLRLSGIGPCMSLMYSFAIHLCSSTVVPSTKMLTFKRTEPFELTLSYTNPQDVPGSPEVIGRFRYASLWWSYLLYAICVVECWQKVRARVL